MSSRAIGGFSCFVLAVLLTAPTLRACLWDYDTIRDERRGMPGIAEVLAGRYEKHSQFFYQQRVAQMTLLLKTEPRNLDAWDNLAVAYEKLGDHDKAISTILKKDALAPGQYTTFANLGTFFMLKGDFENGIVAIRKALQINPNAHFGREEYQLKLGIYFRDARKNPEILRQENFLEHDGLLPAIMDPAQVSAMSPATMRRFEPWGDLSQRPYGGYPQRIHEFGLKDNVFDGVVGMIRFGPGNSAELYLTLGDLLLIRGNKLLAYRAFQRAVDLHHPRTEYLTTIMATLHDSVIIEKGDISAATIAQERADAESWVKAYQNFEDDLVRRGIDTNEATNYQVFYSKYGPPIPALTRWEEIANWQHHNKKMIIAEVIVAGCHAANREMC